MKVLHALVLLVFVGALAWWGWQDANHAVDLAKPWMTTIVTREEFAALDWVRANTPERTLFVTDIFGGELVMGQTLREGTEGGDWAIVPNVVQRMSDFDAFYSTSDAAQAHEIAVKYGARFVWAPNRQTFAGFGWKPIETTKFQNTHYFHKVFDNGATIYEVV